MKMFIIHKNSFTLIEITISLLILAIGLLGLLALFPVGFDASKRAGDITTASILAQGYIEDLKRAGYANLDTYVVNNASYTPPINIPERGWCTNKPTDPTDTTQSHYFEYYIDKTLASVNDVYRPITVTIYWPAEGNNNFASHDFTKMKSYKLTAYLLK